MSDEEEENFCFYGKPLDPYDEDLFPKKRPITVEEQIATDSHGRRRFHGAFTGGFSAGFFNTVGSLEGWTPSDFKSSRSDKQKHVAQNPEDFMDEEDMGEFGFAPQTIKATKDYDTSKKRKRKVFSEGPIPGEPVLHSLLTTGNETVGYLLLKNIGIQEKVDTRKNEISSSLGSRVYGCEIPNASLIESELIDNRDHKLSEFYEQFLLQPKKDTFGLAYTGLDKSHTNLFKSSDLIVREKDKKLSIRGQAFGVGAFERDDDDIYAKEDMSNYDFELTKEKENSKMEMRPSGEILFDIFSKAKVNSFVREFFLPPVIPKSFTGKHKLRKSRFEQIETESKPEFGRKNINSVVRAELLGEEIIRDFTPSKPVLCENQKDNRSVINVKLEEKSSADHSNLSNNSITGASVSSESNMRKDTKFDPNNLWNDRFVSAAQEDDTTNILAPVRKYENDHYGKEMRDAAKLKMFGPLTRISQDWQPCSLLCKRFNVPEPLFEKPNKSKVRTKTKNLIFEYQKHYEDNLIMKAGLTSFSSDAPENQVAPQNDEPTSLEVKKEVKEEENIELSREHTNEESDNNENLQEKKTDEIIDITDKLNIEEKGDLFKSVFLSSSESEEEPDIESEKSTKEEEFNQHRQEELKSNVLGSELCLPKIRPVKEGILSDLNFKTLQSISQPDIPDNKSCEDKTEEKCPSDLTEIDTYGPRLPERKFDKDSNYNVSVDLRAQGNSSSDEWVEKDKISKLKKKKHKKEKYSHKKKHKHKKNKR